MFEPRSLSQIQQEFLQAVVTQGTALSDVSTGSVLFTLGRAFSQVQLQTDLQLLELFGDFYLNTAFGLALEQKAADYGLTRKPGEYASGFVLGISRTEGFSLEPGTVLTEPLSGLQFEVVSDQFAPISAFAETKLPVRATKVGVLGNLTTATKLISPTYPQGAFIVGSHRTSAGEPCGSLQNGLNAETDEELRSRVQRVILFSRSSTEEAIRSALLQEQTVPWVALRYPKPGIIQIWIDNPTTLSAAELERLRQVVLPLKPAGIPVLTSHQAERLLTDINIQVLPTQTVDLQTLTDLLIGLTQTYLLNLSLGETFSREGLLRTFASVSGILSVEITQPATDVIPESLQVVRSQNLRVTYETQ